MRVIIAGGRTYKFTDRDKERLDLFHVEHPIIEVVSGAAPGADTEGEKWAEQNNIPVVRFPAAWSTFGRAAGPLRNGQMLDYIGGAGLLITFPGGRGTDNIRKQAQDKQVACVSFTVD